MKVFCKNIRTIPNVKKIKDLIQQEHLVLEFPKGEMSDDIEKNLISGLKEKLPENYSIFKSGVWENTVTITIKSVLSEIVINKNVEFIKKGIKDYLKISKILLNDSQLNKAIVKEWELIEEHGEHKQYKNRGTGQILETCSYPIISFKSIDPYFFGLFIKTSTNHTELNEMINDDFHDSCRILEFIENNNELKKQITLYMKS